MAGRKADPKSPYKVFLHKDKKYRYAATQKKNSDAGTGTKARYIITHWGTVSEDLVFSPNATYRLTDVEERLKLIFPKDWDISEAMSMNRTDKAVRTSARDASRDINEICPYDDNAVPVSAEEKQPVNNRHVTPSDTVLDQFNNRFYGAFWLLDQLAHQAGVYEDLLSVFNGNAAVVNEVITMAIYPYLSNRNFNRMARWQHGHKTAVDYDLTSSYITRFTQRICDDHRMRLIGLRLKRQPAGSFAACDSTTRSAWGKCLADIRWGKNKDTPSLPNTLEVVVYSITTHEPVYYRTFAGNTMDMSTVRTILSDMKAAGISDITFITDRGYTSGDNILSMIEAGIPFIMCAKTCQKPIVPLLLSIEYTPEGTPIDMEHDTSRHICYKQFDVPPYRDKNPDGTEVLVEGLKANVYLNLRTRLEELLVIDEKLSAEERELKEAVKNNHIPSDIKKYNALFMYHKVSVTQKGGCLCLEYARNDDRLAKDRAVCGYFSSLTYKVDQNAKESLETYKLRDEQEKYFGQMKDQMSFHTQRNSSEDGKTGRLFILFIGLILSSKLRWYWNSTSMCDEYESSLDMLDEMETIRFSEYTNGNSHMTTFSAKQAKICDACNVDVPSECLPRALREAKQRKQNPKKRGRPPKAE